MILGQEQVATLQQLHPTSAGPLQLASSAVESENRDFKAENEALAQQLAAAQSHLAQVMQRCTGSEQAAVREYAERLSAAEAARRQAEGELADVKALLLKAKDARDDPAEPEQARFDSLQLEFDACQRRCDELELALDMTTAEKRQLSSRVSKIDGIQFKQLALDTCSRSSSLKQDQKRLAGFAADSLSEMSASIGIVETALVQQLKLSEHLVRTAVHEREELRALYKCEVTKRKQLYNTLQELRGNLRVYCRVRPLNAKEKLEQQIVDLLESGDELTILDGKHNRRFEFDQVLGPSSTQATVYATVAPLVASVLDGYNVCIFAYGQTGCGKTHTMEGTKEDPGISARAVGDIFQQIACSQDDEYAVRISMMEVYSLGGDVEEVRDLLEYCKGSKLETIRVDKVLGVIVEGLSEHPVCSLEEVEAAVAQGQANRAVACTDIHAHSSRSHLILRIYVESVNKTSGDRSFGKLSLVDLAGSERVKKSGVQGVALAEAQGINASLTHLGNVIRALAANSKHVPYRNSKLTRILSDSLGGDAKTLMFANINPAAMYSQETVCTLNFAVQAKRVATGVVKRNALP
eukprot:TRINITY_DN6958_c0_g1_i3.p1 TRINITY_DN6958_c0_g1~~TRINITY_DN6958_c0_g1_i3.p1  ORF type:complete len:580 (+),score=132.77 TRINITY_DN6958_c0_g1_i3:1380-3119(+)